MLKNQPDQKDLKKIAVVLNIKTCITLHLTYGYIGPLKMKTSIFSYFKLFFLIWITFHIFSPMNYFQEKKYTENCTWLWISKKKLRNVYAPLSTPKTGMEACEELVDLG